MHQLQEPQELIAAESPGSKCNNQVFYFDIRAKSGSVEIVDMLGWTADEGAQVYCRDGSHRGHEHDADGWRQVAVTSWQQKGEGGGGWGGEHDFPITVFSEPLMVPSHGSVGVMLFGTGACSITNLDRIEGRIGCFGQPSCEDESILSSSLNNPHPTTWHICYVAYI